MIYRHGDIDIKPIEELPKGLKKLNDGILAQGEHTNHHHRLSGKYDLYEDAQKVKFMFIIEPTQLSHEEHATITLEPGMYRADIEQEYDYFMETINIVKD